MKLAAVHSPTIAPNHSKLPGRAVEHFGDRLGEHVAHFGRQSREDVDDGQLALLAAAPNRCAIAAARMKNGNSASSDM